MKLLLLLAFAFTLFNTGLIWTIQVVHYPGFLKIGQETYNSYQSFHMRSITMVVGPSMLLELLFSGALLFFLPQLGELRTIYLVSIALLGGIWLHTAFWASPIHGRLLDGFDEALVRQLISANWWRTFAWTFKSLLLGWILYKMIEA